MRTLLASVVLLLALGAIAHADEASEDVKKQAKVHYQNAETAMKEGRYSAAASEYGIAFEVIQDPILFYKIGVAHQLDGKCDAAVVYFKRYIKEGKPKEDFLATVEDKIAACDGAGGTTPPDPDGDGGMIDADPDAVPDADPDPDPEPDADLDADADPDTDTDTGAGTGTGADGPGAPSFLDTQPSWKKSAAWVSVAATVGFGTVGAILLMSSRSRQEDIETLADFRDAQDLPAEYEGTVQERYETLVDEGESFKRWSTIGFAAAGVAAVAAVTLFALEGKGGGESGSVITRITPVIGPDRAGFAAIFGF